MCDKDEKEETVEEEELLVWQKLFIIDMENLPNLPDREAE